MRSNVRHTRRIRLTNSSGSSAIGYRLSTCIEHEIPGSRAFEEAQISRAIGKKFTHYTFRQVDIHGNPLTCRPGTTYVRHGPTAVCVYVCVRRYVRDSSTKKTMTCAASILLTSKPVDVISRPLHAAKRSREHKPYRAIQSTLPLMCRSPLTFSSVQKKFRNFRNIYYTGSLVSPNSILGSPCFPRGKRGPYLSHTSVRIKDRVR